MRVRQRSLALRLLRRSIMGSARACRGLALTSQLTEGDYEESARGVRRVGRVIGQRAGERRPSSLPTRGDERDQAQRRCLTAFVCGVSTPPLSSGYPACSQSAMPPA